MLGRKTIQWYENQLNTNTNLTPSQIEEYENEIERLADIEAKAYYRAQEKKVEERKRFEEIKAKVQSGDANVIDIVGIPEFGGDYDMCQEGGKHIVYSKVANDQQEHRHVHNTAKEAESHYRKLIWDRLYTKYVRSGDYDSLRQME